MQTSLDEEVVTPLHYPRQRPLSTIGRLLIPREWRILNQVERIELPGNPTELLDKIITVHAVETEASIDASGKPHKDDDVTVLTKSDLIEFAIQTWRLQRRVEGMDAEKNKRAYKQFSDSVRRFSKFLQRFEVEFEDPVGKPYTSGWLEVEVVSWDEPGNEESPVASGPWVKQTVSPIIRQHGITIKTGQVICVDIEE